MYITKTSISTIRFPCFVVRPPSFSQVKIKSRLAPLGLLRECWGQVEAATSALRPAAEGSPIEKWEDHQQLIWSYP